jgi:adenosylcobinamide-phosphate synthase
MFETNIDIYSLLSRPYILLMLAFLLDLCIGDPLWLPHPVGGMGWFITKIEGLLRGNKRQKEKIENLSGISLVVIVAGSTYLLFYILNLLLISPRSSYTINFMSLVVMVYMISTTIATKGLIDSVHIVIKHVRDKNLEDARKGLSHIVGRDTEKLDERGILRATVESLAENASDGIIAPFFYFAIGGLPLAMTYKAINTMDSMIGYRNERYRDFGWAAARLDDIVNYLPARITGILIAISSAIVYRSLSTGHSSMKIMLSDGKKHPSPNSGVPEAAMSGALGIMLGGSLSYGGVVINKPYIGIDRSEGKGQDIFLVVTEKAIPILKLTAAFGLVITAMYQYIRVMP